MQDVRHVGQYQIDASALDDGGAYHQQEQSQRYRDQRRWPPHRCGAMCGRCKRRRRRRRLTVLTGGPASSPRRSGLCGCAARTATTTTTGPAEWLVAAQVQGRRVRRGNNDDGEDRGRQRTRHEDRTADGGLLAAIKRLNENYI